MVARPKHGLEGESVLCSWSYIMFMHSCEGAGGSGYTPLHYAAREGHLKVVQLLLKRGRSRPHPVVGVLQDAGGCHMLKVGDCAASFLTCEDSSLYRTYGAGARLVGIQRRHQTVRQQYDTRLGVFTQLPCDWRGWRRCNCAVYWMTSFLQV